MVEGAYFFDTYALFEIIKGNPVYGYYRETGIVTTIINLAELNYGLKRLYDKKTADEYLLKYAKLVVEIKTGHISAATDMKLENKKMSLADTLGYTIAKSMKIKFLTGDEQFRGIENVEFVK